MERDLVAHRPESGDEPLLGDGFDVFTFGVTDLVQPGSARLDLNMGGQSSMRGRGRNDDHHSSGAGIQRIGGDDDCRPTTGLLTSDRLTEVNQPNLASAGGHDERSPIGPASAARSAVISCQAAGSERSSS
jgi:hypothetical protein